ncbi:MAG: hypothetical protein F6K40_36205 [Okeania sp. SIO3I5]|uniref:hypothetical protein n=1 Tax=Okeania sp. SIO3I5 TaxID=2607805 RepID=UPI0013B9A065|nr:hypothetical protein [Okeania sp. SIO3I5]NEQ41351.1 hypothetical protein [Okeania sp. SIO3I5]
MSSEKDMPLVNEFRSQKSEVVFVREIRATCLILKAEKIGRFLSYHQISSYAE